MPAKTAAPNQALFKKARNDWTMSRSLIRLDLIDAEQRRRRQAAVIPDSEVGTAADEHEARQQQYLQACDERSIELAEQNRRRAHADLHVVGTIRHRVLRVIDDDPDHGRQEQQPADARHVVDRRRERHRHAPRERDAEHELRRRQEALRERIDDRDDGARDGESDRQRVQRQHQTERDQHQSREQAAAPRRARPRRSRAADRPCARRADRSSDRRNR